MEIVAIKDMSVGNDSVGEMWQETKIFDSSEPIENVLKWVQDEHEIRDETHTRKRITITVPHKKGSEIF
jgi:predicted transposase YbfD/YdcC